MSCFSKTIDIICLVIVRLRKGDEELDVLYFKVPRMRRGGHHHGRRFVVHITNLQMSFNTLQIYADCVETGKDFTQISLREVIGGNQTVVSTSFDVYLRWSIRGMQVFPVS